MHYVVESWRESGTVVYVAKFLW